MNKLLSLLIAMLWVLAVARILVTAPYLTETMITLIIGFLIVGLPRMPKHTLILCGLLMVAMLGVAQIYGQWRAIANGVANASIFPAFLATIVLLRAAADQRPEIANARQLFSELPKNERDSGIVIGTHLIGAILQVGVFAVLAPILGRNAPLTERREVFTTAIRGMMTVPFWSPFIVGMAVASQYLPLVPLWQIMGLGLLLTVIAILISFALFDRNPGFIALSRSLASLAPVALPVFIAALIVVGATVTLELTTLEALVLALPIPCVLAVLSVRTADIKKAAIQTGNGIGRIGPETLILVCSTTLGAVFEAALPQMGLLNWLNSLALPPWAVILIIIMTMNFAGLFGIHSIVSGTFLLVIFTSVPSGVTDLVLMQSVLVGWGLCSGISIASLTVVTGATMFKIPPLELITRANIAYVFLTSTITAGLLWGLNRALA